MTEPTPTKAAVDAADKPKSFFFNAKTSKEGQGYYDGQFETPDGVVYRGAIFANSGPNGAWYKSGKLTATTPSDFNADSRIDAKVRPAALSPKSTDEPLVVRFNAYDKNDPTKFIGTLWTAKGLYTVFADETAGKYGAQLRINVLPFRSDAELKAAKAQDVDAPDGAAARKRATAKAGKPEPDAPNV